MSLTCSVPTSTNMWHYYWYSIQFITLFHSVHFVSYWNAVLLKHILYCKKWYLVALFYLVQMWHLIAPNFSTCDVITYWGCSLFSVSHFDLHPAISVIWFVICSPHTHTVDSCLAQWRGHGSSHPVHLQPSSPPALDHYCWGRPLIGASLQTLVISSPPCFPPLMMPSHSGWL